VQKSYDVVVIGGGAAGLSGALTLGRARRSVLVIDAGFPRNAPAAHVHNYLGREGMNPAELLAAGRVEVAGYGGEVVTGTVTSARPLGGCDVGFRVELADGCSVEARRLLVTTGLVDELPDVAGLAQRWGRDVLHCPYCHGYEVRDQALGVLATNPMGVHQALLFRQWSADVTLFLHTAAPVGADEREQLVARGIAVVEGEVAALVVTDDQLTGIQLHSGQVVARQALVVAPRFTARADVLTTRHAVAAYRARPEVAEQFWDARYAGEHRIWSGNPNPVLVREAAQLKPGAALDLGCGEGADAVWLAQQGWQVTGVDISQVALDRAAEHASDAGVADCIDWQRRDLGVSFPTGSFDLVSAQFLHSYFDLPRDAILRAAAAAVAPGGVLLVVGHAGPPSCDPDLDLQLPTPEEVFAALDLPTGQWEQQLSEEFQQSLTGPDGLPATRTNNALKIRRRTT